MNTNNSKRNANIELLRIISMMMVITLHGLDKGGLLANVFNGGGLVAAWILESLSIMAVNIYMLISGYFLVKSDFKCGRLIELICQVMFYSLGVVFALSVTGLLDISCVTRYEWSIVLFPFHMSEYWFATSYILMYLFAPVVALAARNMKKGQLLAIIIMLLIYESVIKSISPIAFETDDKGYSATWFMTVFLIAAYLRLYGFGLLNKAWKGFVLYLVSASLIFAEDIYLQYRYSLAGSFELIQGVSFHYNHILVILAAVGIFVMFANAKEINGLLKTIIIAISPMSFGVYLLHEQKFVRTLWPEWLGLTDSMLSGLSLVAKVALAVLIVYVVGTLVDFVRRLIFKAVAYLVSKSPLHKLIIKIDSIVNAK